MRFFEYFRAHHQVGPARLLVLGTKPPASPVLAARGAEGKGFEAILLGALGGGVASCGVHHAVSPVLGAEGPSFAW